MWPRGPRTISAHDPDKRETSELLSSGLRDGECCLGLVVLPVPSCLSSPRGDLENRPQVPAFQACFFHCD